MRHQFQSGDASRTRGVAQASVEETLDGKSAAADRGTDSETTIHVVAIVDRTRENCLGVRGEMEKNVAVDGLAKGLSRIVVHPSHFVHVLGGKPRFGDTILFQNSGDALSKTRIDMDMLVSVHVVWNVSNECNKTFQLQNRSF